jgi:quercetin dioxygenase-like cupin family protein
MIGKINDVNDIIFTSPLAKHASMKALVSPLEGWKDHVLRVVSLEKEGYSPKHQHPWPHINYVLEGQGEIEIGGIISPVSAGSYAFVPGDTLHQFRNTGKDTFKFICIVPVEGHKY